LNTIKFFRSFSLILLSFNVCACASGVKNMPVSNAQILKNDLYSKPYSLILQENIATPRTAIPLQEEIATPSTATILEENLATPSTTQTIDSFEKPQIQLLAAHLAEIGYFQGNIRQAELQDIESALKLFQSDLGLPQTGQLDEFLWKKLQVIELSDDIKSQMLEKEENFIDVNFQQNEQVFAVEKVKCKSTTEAWILFYEGFIQEIQSDSLSVKLTKRYGLWYDFRHQGISDENWWCIPSKRFCYSPIAFSDWGGKLKAGDIENFDKRFSVPYSLNITSLVPDLFRKICKNAD